MTRLGPTHFQKIQKVIYSVNHANKWSNSIKILKSRFFSIKMCIFDQNHHLGYGVGYHEWHGPLHDIQNYFKNEKLFYGFAIARLVFLIIAILARWISHPASGRLSRFRSIHLTSFWFKVYLHLLTQFLWLQFPGLEPHWRNVN